MNTEHEFRKAAGKGNVERMQEILDQDDSILSFENPDDLPLERLSLVQRVQTACNTGDLASLTALLDEYPDLLNTHWTAQRWFPLSQAVCAKQYEIIDFLVGRGADLDLRYEKGGTALHMAAWTGDVDLAQKLLGLGIPLNITNDDGNTPLDVAVERRRDGLIDHLESIGGKRIGQSGASGNTD